MPDDSRDLTRANVNTHKARASGKCCLDGFAVPFLLQLAPFLTRVLVHWKRGSRDCSEGCEVRQEGWEGLKGAGREVGKDGCKLA